VRTTGQPESPAPASVSWHDPARHSRFEREHPLGGKPLPSCPASRRCRRCPEYSPVALQRSLSNGHSLPYASVRPGRPGLSNMPFVRHELVTSGHRCPEGPFLSTDSPARAFYSQASRAFFFSHAQIEPLPASSSKHGLSRPTGNADDYRASFGTTSSRSRPNLRYEGPRT